MIENTQTITDELMKEMISKTKNYCIVLLKHGPNWNMAGAEKLSGNMDEEILLLK